MYGYLLFGHAWVRWSLLILGVLTILSTTAALRAGRAWSQGDERLARLLVGLGDVQLLLGLSLWLFSSPLTRLAFSERLLFKGAPFTFFALVHPVVMLAALLWLHVGRATHRKRPEPSAHARWRTTTAIWLALVTLAVPWPLWSFGRELVKGLP